MKKSVYDLVFKIVTGVEMITEAICAFVIKDTFIKTSVCASIPLVANCVTGICSNFVKEESK